MDVGEGREQDAVALLSSHQGIIQRHPSSWAAILGARSVKLFSNEVTLFFDCAVRLA